MAKDIFWFHSVYWPAMLMSAELPIPKIIFAHGYWTFNKEKISKSRGKIINIDELIALTGNPDSARYFLLRHTAFGDDGDFSEKALVDRHNTELLNKLGNLVSRTSGLIEKNGMEKCSNSLKIDLNKIKKLFEKYEFDKILNEVFAFIDKTNEYIQNNKPWETKDKKVLYEIADAIKQIVILLSPFMPETCKKIAEQFHFDLTLEQLDKQLEVTKIKKEGHLFLRIEYKVQEQKVNKEPEIKEIMDGVAELKFEDWTKVDLRVGEITNVGDIEGADKLYNLTIDLGEEKPRTILSGLKDNYTAEELSGMKVIVISNLAPRKMRGVMSEGMILAAVSDDDSKVILISPSKNDIENGSKVC